MNPASVREAVNARPRRKGLGGLLPGLLLLAGCATTPIGREIDPLVGGPPLPSDSAPPGAPALPGPPARGSRAEVPPLPPALAPTSPAALTSGATGAGLDRRATEASVTLGGPRPPEQPAARLRPMATPSAGVTPASAMLPAAGAPSYEQLQEMLLARGVVWQQLRSGVAPGEWHFTCAIPHREQPNVRRTYEARAVGAHGLAAIRAVLEDIDRDRKTGQ